MTFFNQDTASDNSRRTCYDQLAILMLSSCNLQFVLCMYKSFRESILILLLLEAVNKLIQKSNSKVSLAVTGLSHSLLLLLPTTRRSIVGKRVLANKVTMTLVTPHQFVTIHWSFIQVDYGISYFILLYFHWVGIMGNISADFKNLEKWLRFFNHPLICVRCTDDKRKMHDPTCDPYAQQLVLHKCYSSV